MINSANGRWHDEAVAAACRDMRRHQPHYWAVFRVWYDGMDRRSWEPLETYAHGLHKGFWADTAKRLSISEGAVRFRFKRALKYFDKRYRQRRGSA